MRHYRVSTDEVEDVTLSFWLYFKLREFWALVPRRLWLLTAASAGLTCAHCVQSFSVTVSDYRRDQRDIWLIKNKIEPVTPSWLEFYENHRPRVHKFLLKHPEYVAHEHEGVSYGQ